MPCFSWRSGSTALRAPSETFVEPPRMPHFSMMTTCAPAWAAVMAAHRPAPPPPTTQTSASYSPWISAAGCGSDSSDAVSPAWAAQSLTACRSAALEMLAPVTPSQLSDWARTTSWERRSSAALPTPNDSWLSEASMSLRAFFVNVTFTVNGALCPLASAVYCPASYPLNEPSPLAEQPTRPAMPPAPRSAEPFRNERLLHSAIDDPFLPCLAASIARAPLAPALYVAKRKEEDPGADRHKASRSASKMYFFKNRLFMTSPISILADSLPRDHPERADAISCD